VPLQQATVWAEVEQDVVERAALDLRDLLECVWPAALETANWPFRSKTWAAAMWIILDRDGGDLARTRRLGLTRFEQQVRREITRRGGQRPCLRIVRKLFTALADPTGVLAHRRGALERVQLLLEDWADTGRKLVDTENRMTAVLDDLELTALVTTIHGLSPVGAAAILAETGDPTRFATARALVKHAGLAPREKLSGTFTGRTKLTGQGRPKLRLAAWRAAWGALQTNTVYAAATVTSPPASPTSSPHAGADGDRRRDPAAPARGDHHRPSVGPGHRHPRHPRQEGDHPGCLAA
jgi:transposase